MPPKGHANRLIPAHAGKTRGRTRLTRPRPAHPRSRGENETATAQGLLRDGSSPLTRGKRDLWRVEGEAVRLIPAHAGKTRIREQAGTAQPAHPRSRGENTPCEYWTPPSAGSSPLTRGKRALPTREARGQGLIPAHAGKTGFTDVAREAATAHPRSRGENREGRSSVACAGGSSPLTRGKQPLHAH